jgi:hypothetical protein
MDKLICLVWYHWFGLHLAGTKSSIGYVRFLNFKIPLNFFAVLTEHKWLLPLVLLLVKLSGRSANPAVVELLVKSKLGALFDITHV